MTKGILQCRAAAELEGAAFFSALLLLLMCDSFLLLFPSSAPNDPATAPPPAWVVSQVLAERFLYGFSAGGGGFARFLAYGFLTGGLSVACSVGNKTTGAAVVGCWVDVPVVRP